MAQLIRYEFTCPFCGKEKVTFVTDNKLKEVKSRKKLIQEIFSPHAFKPTYREIFVSNICSECQSDVFDNNEDGSFDIDINNNTAELESAISDMYDNTRE